MDSRGESGGERVTGSLVADLIIMGLLFVAVAVISLILYFALKTKRSQARVQLDDEDRMREIEDKGMEI